jgi:PAS domain S-box-containing protein
MENNQIRVLLIEDNPTDVLLLLEALGKDSLNAFELTTVERLSAAIKTLQKDSFDIILLDLGLPDSQGLSTFTKIHEAAPGISKVILSGLDDEIFGLQAVHAGAQDYMVKSPVSFSYMARAIRHAIERQRTEETLRENERQLQALVTSLDDIVFQADAHGTYVNVWAADESLLFRPREQLIGRRFDEIFGKETSQPFFEVLARVLESGTPETLEYSIQLADGQHWFAARYNPIQSKDGAQKTVSILVRDISGRKSLELEQQKQWQMINGANDAIIIRDHDTDVITYWNEGAEKMYGWKRQDVIGKYIHEFLHTQFPYPFEDLKRNFLHNGKWEGELIHIRNDGVQISVMSRWSIQHDAEGRPSGFLEINTDITERKQAEEQLRAEQLRFTQVAATLPGAICTFKMSADGSFNVPYASQAFEDLFGLTLADVAKNVDAILERIPPDQVVPLLEAVSASAATLTPWRNEFRYRHPRKGDIWLEGYSMPVRESDGSTIWHGVTTDITERKQFETTLQESSARFHTLFEASPDAIMIIDPYDEWSILDCNTATCEMNGYTREELIGQPINILNLTPGNEVERLEYMDEIRKAGVLRLESHHRRKDGSIFPIEISTSMFALGGRQVILGIDRDITERKQAENALRESEKRFRSLIEHSTDGFVITRLDGTLSYESPNTEKITGFKPEERVGKSGFDNVHPDDVAAVKAKFSEAVSTPGITVHVEYRSFRKDGSIWWTETAATNMLEEPSVRGIVVNFRDITDRKQVESALQESEKKYRYLFENIPYPMWAYDLKTLRFLAVNNSAVKKYGYSQTEFLNMTIADIRPVEDMERLKENIAQPRPPLQHSGEWRHRLKDGTIIYVEISSHTIKLANRDAALVVALDITERRKAEQELRESNERFTELANNVSDIFWVSEPLTRKNLYVSPAFESIVGQSVDAVSKLPNGFLDAILPEDRHILIEAREHEHRGIKTEIQYRILRPDGSIRWMRDKGTPVFDEKGKVVRVAGIARDLTEQVEAEMQLRESESRFRQLAENIEELFWMFDIERQHIIYASPAYEVIWGRSRENLYRDQQDYVEAVLPEDKGPMLASFEKQLAGEPTDMEYRIRRPDGTIRWIWDRSFPIFNDEKKLIRTAGIATDITENKKARQELEELNRELEERIQERTTEVMDLYDNAPAGYHSLDANGCLIRINKTELDWFGYAPEEILGRPFKVLLTDEGVKTFEANFPDFKKRGWVRNLEFDLVRKDGTTFPTLVNATAIYDEQGQYAMSRSTVFDNTERRRVEDTLRASQVRLNFLLANTPAIIFTSKIAAGMPTTFISNSVHDILGYEPAQYLENERFWLSRVHPDDLGYAAEAFQTLTTQGHAIWESRVKHAKGHWVWTSTGMSLVRNKQGQPSEVIGYSVDINDKKLVEEALQVSEAQLRQSRDDLSIANAALERASRLKDEFLASMSHELRTPLTSILGLSEVLGLNTYGEMNEKQTKTVKTIEESGRHLLELINDILDLSKIEAGKLELQFSPCSITDVCQASLQLIKGMAQQKRQTVHYSPPKETMIIRADARRLKQILVNLLSNAVKFTKDGGELGLDIQADRPGRVIRMTVWDKGIGIKAENIPGLFNPFTQIDSSLAREYSGTGLGLSLVQRLVKLHNGGIETESVFGSGTRFTVSLPWSPDNTTPIPYNMQYNRLQGTGSLAYSKDSTLPRIFIADDNEVVLQMVADYLEAKEYRVNKARSGLELLEQIGEVRPDAIIMDIQMPGMSGLETLRLLRAHTDPQIAQIPVVAVTALAMTGDRERCLEAGANEYMSKPVKLKELTATLQKLIGIRK